MSEFSSYSYVATEDGLKSYVLKVFIKMGLGLLVTSLVAYLGFRNIMQGGMLYHALVSDSGTIMVILPLVQLGVCMALSAGLYKFSVQTANVLFFAYAALTGVTFSVLPIMFEVITVFAAFAFAAVVFLSCAVIGYTTKVDISRFSGLLMGGLFALVALSIASMFIPILRESLWISYLTVILFVGITAWDMQRIKAMYLQSVDSQELAEKFSVYGAFQLYLDFINLFIAILRIFGSRRRR